MPLFEHSLAPLAVLSPLFPAAACAGLGFLFLLGFTPREAHTFAVVMSALLISWLLSVAILVSVFFGSLHSHVVDLPPWFSTPHYAFEVVFFIDRLSATMFALTTTITVLIAKFSRTYLHREAGFTRFFFLIALFSSAMQLLILAGTLDLLFVGWELVGLTSVLLVAFFHERLTPVRSALRIFIAYRLCDLGLLIGAAMLHRVGPFVDFAHLRQGTPHVSAATWIGLCFLIAAMGKSAQYPVGGWLPRAMEGPTPSSALFYGAISVHAGAYLLLRAFSIIHQSAVASFAVIAVGLISATVGTLCWRVQCDVKSEIAFATMTQLGLIFAEIGLGWRTFALVHIVGHAGLRTWQLIHAPSALAEIRALRSLQPRVTGAGWLIERLPSRAQALLYRIAFERFRLDVLENTLANPVARLAEAVSSQETRLTKLMGGRHRTISMPAVKLDIKKK